MKSLLRRKLVSTMVVLTVVATSFSVAPPANAETMPDVGVQFHATWSDYSDSQRAAVLDKMAAAGVKWVRIDVGWRALEEAGPGAMSTTSKWYVDLFSRSVDMANARGIKVLATILDTPKWANGGASKNVPPTNVADYARMARWMAERFRGRVAAWEVWNEPNLEGFWAGRDPVRYAALVRAAYPAFKGGDPSAAVVIGAVSQNDDAWLSRMYDAGVVGYYDVLSTHPYQGPSDGIPELPDTGGYYIMNHIRAVYLMMVARGEGEKPIWATEFGWSSHPNTGTEPPWKRGVTEDQQADYLVRSLAQFSSQHPYVKNVFWYNDRNKATGDPQEDNYGILRRDLTDKPVYRALKSTLTTGAAVPAVQSPLTTPEPAETSTSVSTSPSTTTSPSGSDTTAATPPPPATPATFHPVAPARILDTRNGTGQGGRTSQVGTGKTITVDVTGVGGVPAGGVTSVVMNVTSTQATAPSFLSVTPSGGNSTSSLNFTPGRDQANLVTVPVGSDGNVRAYNHAGATHVIFDVVGWYGDASAPPGARHRAVNPARILDTRNGTGRGGTTAKVDAGQTITLDVTGVGGVPASGVSAVTMNVTATESTTSSFLSVTPSGGNSTSSLNFMSDRNVPNLVTVPVGPDGNVRIYNNAGATHVVADVSAWYTLPGATTGASFTPVTPSRIVDTRIGTGTAGSTAPVGPGRTLTADVTGVGGVPSSGVSAVVVNVTVTQPTMYSFASVTPNGGNASSNLNFVPGQDVPNLVVVAVGSDGNVRAYNNAGSTHVIFDVVGWFSPQA